MHVNPSCLQVILPLPVVMVSVAIFLVFVPIIGEPMDAAIAVGLILPAIPVYFIFVYKYKHRPKIFTRINGMYIRTCTVFSHASDSHCVVQG